MSVQVCKFEPTKTIAISAGGSDVALKWFGMDESAIEAACGRFARGKNKGKLRGWIVYRKVREGGWSFPLHSVLRPGLIFAVFCKTFAESAEVFGASTEKFMSRATRVDRQYGYEPKPALEISEPAKRYIVTPSTHAGNYAMAPIYASIDEAEKMLRVVQSMPDPTNIMKLDEWCIWDCSTRQPVELKGT